MKRQRLYKGEKIIRTLSPMGLSTGEFITTKSTLPQLIAINKSSEGTTYFRWAGIKPGECV